MLRPIIEPDWKVFRKLHPIVLERYCQRIVSEVAGLTATGDQTHLDRYLAIAKLMRQTDEEIRLVFDDLRRSTALEQILFMRSRGLLTDEEMDLFSDDTKGVMALLLG